MKYPDHAKLLIGIIMAIVIVIMTGFGALGYLVYGDNIKGSITLNLRGNSASASTTM